MSDDDPVTTNGNTPPPTEQVLHIGGPLHAQLRGVELGHFGDGPDLVLPPTIHDLATGSSYARRSIDMTLRDTGTGANKGSYTMPVYVSLDVRDAATFQAMAVDACMQLVLTHYGRPADTPSMPDPASNGHMRPSGLIVPPGRG